MTWLLSRGVVWTIGLALVLGMARAPLWAAASSLVIVYAGDTDGEYEPCGCPGSPIGGFARRATLEKQIRQSGTPMVVLDAGNALLKSTLTLDPRGGRNARHVELMASMLNKVGVQAAAVGPRDLWAAGLAVLRAQASQGKVPWLSANLVDARGASPFPPSRVLRAGDLRIGVIGLTEPIALVSRRENVTFIDPVVATRRQMELLRGRVDLLIVLSNLNTEMNETLREQAPGLDFIVTGNTPEGSPLVAGPRPPWIVRVHGEGRYVGRLDLRLTPGSARPLLRSEPMERRLADLEASRISLQTLRKQIVLEEGRFDQKRFDAEGQLLREHVEALSHETEGQGADVRIFAHRELPLGENLADDPEVAARIRDYNAANPAKKAPERPGSGSGPDTPGTRKNAAGVSAADRK